MAFYIIKMMVKRIPSDKYVEVIYTCDGAKQTSEDVFQKLINDKNVVDFYQIY